MNVANTIKPPLLTEIGFIWVACVLAPHRFKVGSADRTSLKEHSIQSVEVVGFQFLIVCIYLPMIVALSSEQQTGTEPSRNGHGVVSKDGVSIGTGS